MGNIATLDQTTPTLNDQVLGLVDDQAKLFPVGPMVAARSRAQVETSGASYTLGLDDEGKTIKHSHTAACVVNLPTNDSVAFPIGARIKVAQWGVGQITITPISGVTLRSAGRTKSRARYSPIYLEKVGTNEWLMDGDTMT